MCASDRPPPLARRSMPTRARPGHITARLAAVLALALLVLVGTAAAQGERRLETQSGVLWQPYLEWTIATDEPSDAPYDVEATATFLHAESDAQHVTPLFYAGDATWAFRFTATRSGTWHVSTSSDHAPLDGWTGTVEVEPNADPAAHGFLTATGTTFAVPIDEDGTLEARTYNVYMNAPSKNAIHDYSSDPETLAAEVAEILDEVEAHGMDALFVAVNNSWFEFGASASSEHDSEDPSETTFAVLETLILRAFERGLSVHVWAWGDEERGWTPIGVDGINGPADRRLQRTIAGRLGPLPGWTMSYGFDLDEWVTPAEVHDWWTYMHAHMGWPRLLMARESQEAARGTDREFTLGDVRLDVVSSDERPDDAFFETARVLLDRGDGPVLFERRFLHTRDGVWDQETTRRALWEFTLAGGAGGVWGVLWDDGEPYPEPGVLRTHGRFWSDRLAADLDDARVLDGDDRVIVARSSDGERAVVYAQDATSIPLDLADFGGERRAVAVDAAAPYEEIDLGEIDPDVTRWSAPYRSDWVVAMGRF